MNTAALLSQMEKQAAADKAAADKRLAAMSDTEKKSLQKTARHMAAKMQSSVA